MQYPRHDTWPEELVLKEGLLIPTGERRWPLAGEWYFWHRTADGQRAAGYYGPCYCPEEDRDWALAPERYHIYRMVAHLVIDFDTAGG
jgi:hypothetical protein